MNFFRTTKSKSARLRLKITSYELPVKPLCILGMLAVVACQKEGETISSPESTNEQIIQDGSDVIAVEVEGSVSGDSVELPQWVGRGFDALTGEQKEFCLDPSTAQVSVTPLNSTESSMEIVHTHSELYKSLNVDINFEASGIYQMFTGSGSLSTRVMKSTRITNDDIKVMAQLIYKKEERQLENPSNAKAQISGLYQLSDSSEDSMYDFRSQCGDSYVDKVTLGSRLVLVFSANNYNELGFSRVDVEAAIRIGFSGVLGLGLESQLTDEQQEILNQLSYSSQCYTEGDADATICADFGLNFDDSENFLSDLNESFREIRNRFASSLDPSGEHVKLGEGLGTYPSASDVVEGGTYYSFYERQKHLNDLASVLGDIETLCDSIDFMTGECQDTSVNVSDEIRKCADQNRWLSECNELYDVDTYRQNFNELLSIGDAGEVMLYEDNNFTGRGVALNFNNLFNQFGDLKAESVTNLDTDNFAFNDDVSSIRGSLKPGWRLVLFEDVNGGGLSYSFEGEFSSADFRDFEFNDEVSSFILERVSD